MGADLYRSQACQKTQPAHSACTTTTRQEGAKEIGCLQAETRQQEASSADALEHSSEDADESWTVFRDTVHSSAKDSLGPVSYKHQDWFDQNQNILLVTHQ